MPTSGPGVGVRATSDLQMVAKGVPKVSAKFQIEIRKTVRENPLSVDSIFGNKHTYLELLQNHKGPKDQKYI